MKVTLTDPPETLTVDHDARDRRAAELRFGALVKARPGTPMRTLMEAHPETWISWICWHAATRQHVTDITWDQWSGRALEVTDEGTDSGVLPDPTNPAQ